MARRGGRLTSLKNRMIPNYWHTGDLLEHIPKYSNDKQNITSKNQKQQRENQRTTCSLNPHTGSNIPILPFKLQPLGPTKPPPPKAASPPRISVDVDYTYFTHVYREVAILCAMFTTTCKNNMQIPIIPFLEWSAKYKYTFSANQSHYFHHLPSKKS